VNPIAGLEAQAENPFGTCWELSHDSSVNPVLSPPHKPRPMENISEKITPQLSARSHKRSKNRTGSRTRRDFL